MPDWKRIYADGALCLQGIIMVGVGSYSMYNPSVWYNGESTKRTPELDTFAKTASLMAPGIGVMFVIISQHPAAHHGTFRAQIALRLVAAVVFWDGARGTAYNELVWAAINALGAYITL